MKNGTFAESIVLASQPIREFPSSRDVTRQTKEQSRANRSVRTVDAWQQAHVSSEQQRAETEYQQAVENYLTLVAKAGDPDFTSRLEELDAAKLAVEICREQYRSLLLPS